MSDNKGKGWRKLFEDIFVSELLFSLIDWILGILESMVTILRIILLVSLILGAVTAFWQS